MADKSESKIKTESLEDISTAIEIVEESNHPRKKRIMESLKTIDDFCDRWWEI